MTDTTANETIDGIANRCLELLEERLKPENRERGQFSDPVEVKAVGEALKALAEGIESYKRATKKPIKMDFKSP